MDWVYVLASIEGRISRKPFWIGFLILSAIELLTHFTGGERWSAVVGLILAYPEFALLAKRGHDRRVPTWVVALFIIGGCILDVLSFLGMTGAPDSPNAAVLAIGIPIGILGLILLIDFGFRRGTVGPNQYGPDPLHGHN